jgi:monothiol glutaredoxin
VSILGCSFTALSRILKAKAEIPKTGIQEKFNGKNFSRFRTLKNSKEMLCSPMKVILYRKSGCPWAAAVMGFLNELAVPFELRNVTSHPQYAKELEEKSGRCISPTLDIDGKIIADASVEDVGKMLEEHGIVL